MLNEGTTTVEVKSGYGLSTADELKMLRAIRDAAHDSLGTVVSTALIAHAIDADHPSRQAFIEATINETLDAVHDECPAITIDAYCEDGAWSLDECARLFERARSLGHPFRVHADQFNALGMAPWAIEHGAVSVDHLEATTDDDLHALARSETFGVMLPCSGFHTDGRYANGRAFIDAGGALVIATNCNPGSAPTNSMPMAVALAARFNGLTPAEAITACTANAAALLGFDDRGYIAPGARADLVLLRHTDERALAFEFGGNPVEVVVCGGAIIASE
jgi:imidazolonepropionase